MCIPLAANCQIFRFTEYSIFLHVSFKILIGAFIAFLMEVCEVMVVTYTSSLTLSVAGIFKELFILFLAVALNGDKMSGINIVGLLLCLVGIVSHVIHKVRTTPMSTISWLHDIKSEQLELGESLLDNTLEPMYLSSESDGEFSETEVLFNILNRHDR